MTSFNKVILMGNLTKDPEIRYTPSGTPVANFRLAVNNRYKQGEEFKEEVCYIDIVVFGKQAENCGQYLGKGQGVIVDGRLQERRWETEDGVKRSKHEVVAQTVRFMSRRQGAPSEKSALGGEGMPEPETEAVDNDVPF
ncbi:MAG TPA: single-stranded DNA-binding protein [Nitrospiria bacterium]|jgi:single-strand DNA-binding protein|nr:single-stranded DNA-binding protein [Nitrospiria bacterium]